jgi:ribosomal protein L2
MSRQIELNIGKDLQFIRVNGTLVGGTIGLILLFARNPDAVLHLQSGALRPVFSSCQPPCSISSKQHRERLRVRHRCHRDIAVVLNIPAEHRTA